MQSKSAVANKRH